MKLKLKLKDILAHSENDFKELIKKIKEIYRFELKYSAGLIYRAEYRFTSNLEKVDCLYDVILMLAPRDIIDIERDLIDVCIKNQERGVVFYSGEKPSTVERACKMIQVRANVGQVKYGVSIDRDDLTASDWAQHAIEEMLDGAQYLIRLKDEMEALQKENAELKKRLSELDK